MLFEESDAKKGKQVYVFFYDVQKGHVVKHLGCYEGSNEHFHFLKADTGKVSWYDRKNTVRIEEITQGAAEAGQRWMPNWRVGGDGA